jgi:uridylate kinase
MAKHYKRIMLKFSGEVLKGKDESIDFSVMEKLCKEIKDLHKKKIQIAVVVGGGNIWRYRDNKGKGISRVESDFMGMTATVMNGMAMQSTLERLGVPARVMSALTVQELAEPYVRRKALDHLNSGRVLICAGGTGRPFFTTDSAAALRGLELDCEVFLKATKVDGVYDKDPMKHKNAKRYDSITFDEVLKKRLAFMDQTASALCREGNLKVVVFDLMKKGNLGKVVAGSKTVGTTVHV